MRTSFWFSAALVVTLLFGSIKEAKQLYKTAVPSAQTRDIGATIGSLRREFFGRDPALRRKRSTAVYVTDLSGRPPEEYRYGAQYALAPILLVDDGAAADLTAMEFRSPETLDRHLSEGRFRTVLRSGATALAENGQR